MADVGSQQPSVHLNLYSSDSWISWHEYENFRPQYPALVYETTRRYLESYNTNTEINLCVDYGSGSCIAVPGILERCAVQKVLATDLNERQLIEGKTKLRATYDEKRLDTLVGAAGELDSILDGTVDLCTAAEACHWFDLPKWYKEVARILKPNGVLAFWLYPPQCFLISHPEATAACNTAFERLFALNGVKARLSFDQILAGTTLLDNIIVDEDLFVDIHRYKWLIPLEISEKIGRDALYSGDDVQVPFLAPNAATSFHNTPEVAKDVLMQRQNWTSTDLIRYMTTLGFDTNPAIRDSVFCNNIKKIEDTVGGPEGVFDVAWPLCLVLALRR